MVGPILDFFILMLACALNDRMQKKLDYTQEDVRVLKEIIKDFNGGKRIRFTVGQQRRLAVLGKEMTPKERQEVCQVVMPGTILTWFRNLVAKKYDG